MAITAAGAGSGLQLEDIIRASLDAKRTQFESRILKQETTLKTSLSGVGQLKSALSEFTKLSKELAKADAFNLRTINITQSKDNPVLKVEGQLGASNGNYDIIVNNLASGSKFESKPGAFSSSSQVIATADGQLTFSAGADKSFTVDVKAGDTLNDLRGKINTNGKNFGLSTNIVNQGGESKLIFDSSVTGTGNDLTISASTPELKIFDTSDTSSKLTSTKTAIDASVSIDGVTVSNKTNILDNVIQGMKVTLLRESDKDSSAKPIANKVAITTDTKGIKDKIQSFITAYNTLSDAFSALGKRPTIVAGKRNDDGGLLAGDSTLRSISDFMFSTLSSANTGGGAINNVFDMGIKVDNKGKLSIDSVKLDSALNNNFDQVGALFSGENGIAAKMTKELEEYTRTGGRLAQREDVLNVDMRDIKNKRSTFEDSMVVYEKSLRKKYGDLDVLVTKLNKSAASLSMLQ